MLDKLIVKTLPLFPESFIWIFSKKYIAGKTLDEALNVIKKLNAEDYPVTIDLLGEFISELKEAEATREAYLGMIDSFVENKIQGSFSVKPTFFGLLLDEEKCYENIRAVVQKAAEYGKFVRIDMEDSQCTDKELALYLRLKEEFPNSVGLVLQAYLKRTLADIKMLEQYHSEESPVDIRLCKGIYVESEAIAYKKYKEINDNYMLLLDYLLKMGARVGIATHDKLLINASLQKIEEYKIPSEQYEFQMLYGVTPELHKGLKEKEVLLRIYTPYGVDWFGYSTRRLKENPKIARHIIKSLFK